MSPVHHEKVFESAIETALRDSGWMKGSNELYSHALGLNPTELLGFVRATQPKEWDRLVVAQAGDDAALFRMGELLADASPVLGDRDPFILETRREFGKLLALIGHHGLARSVLRPLLADLAALHGVDHPETRLVRDLLENLGRLLDGGPGVAETSSAS